MYEVKRAKQSENRIKPVIDTEPGQDIDHGGNPQNKCLHIETVLNPSASTKRTTSRSRIKGQSGNQIANGLTGNANCARCSSAIAFSSVPTLRPPYPFVCIGRLTAAQVEIVVAA